ncbi:MAG: thioredoxin [Thermoanaerobaculales bacterium]|jgi:thioredoxin 1|nr:thioredoxin [Thermoanaerobaculales bacterium]
MAVSTLTKENFDRTIADNDIVIIDFWADWCGPCKMFKPVFEKASERHRDVAFVTCDTEAQRELAASFQIRSIPTTVIFREQIPVFFQPGMLPPEAIDELLGKVRELDMTEVRKTVETEAARA